MLDLFYSLYFVEWLGSQDWLSYNDDQKGSYAACRHSSLPGVTPLEVLCPHEVASVITPLLQVRKSVCGACEGQAFWFKCSSGQPLPQETQHSCQARQVRGNVFLTHLSILAFDASHTLTSITAVDTDTGAPLERQLHHVRAGWPPQSGHEQWIAWVPTPWMLLHYQLAKRHHCRVEVKCPQGLRYFVQLITWESIIIWIKFSTRNSTPESWLYTFFKISLFWKINFLYFQLQSCGRIQCSEYKCHFLSYELVTTKTSS